MRADRALRVLLLAVVAGSGASCAHRRADQPPPAAVPERFASASGEAREGGVAPDRWWTSFGDPGLDAWVERVLADNRSLARAWARLEQARYAARIAGADRQPSLSLEASARRAQSQITGPSGVFERTLNQFAVGFAASYEADLWGRVAAVARAAGEDLRASRADLDTAALTLASETTEAWFAMAEQRSIRALLDDQISTSREFTELVEFRFGRGLSSALDVFQQRQQTASLESLVPAVDARIDALGHQLAVLAGIPPGIEDPPVAAALPAPPPMPDPGLPADLLRRRPDVAAAEARLRAADDRAAAAIANRLPALRLGAGIGTQSPEASDLFDTWVWNLAGNLAAPLLDGGRRKAEAGRAGAVRDEAIESYRLTVLQALREVEDALALERRQEETIDRLDAQRAAAASTLAQARTVYANGQAEYLSVLTAFDRLQQIDRARVSAQRQRLSYRVQLHRALGGDWMSAVGPPREPSGES